MDYLILLLVWASTSLPFLSPNLTGDDWYNINSLVVNHYPWIDFNLPRPLDTFLFHLYQYLWGYNTWAYTASAWVLWLLIAFVFYSLLRRIFPGENKFLPLIAALFLLFHPAYQLRLWITASNLSLALLFVPIFAWFLFEYAQQEKLYYLGAALIAYTISLMQYEGQMGIALAWCLFLTLQYPLHSRLRRLFLMAGPILITGAAVWWRFRLNQATAGDLDITGQYLQRVQQLGFIPAQWISRLLDGIKTLTFSWLAPFVGSNLNKILGNPIVIAILIGSTLTFIFLFTYRIWKLEKETGKGVSKIKTTSVHSSLKMLLVGITLSLAGYLPVIFALMPGLDFYSSRANLFALPGASIVLVSLLNLGAVGIKKLLSRTELTFAALSIPFILMGVLFQLEIQFESQRVWSAQSNIWQQIFVLAPDFSNDSFVVVIFNRSEYNQDPVRRDIMITPWEVERAVQILYINQTLSGSVYFVNRPDISHFTQDGFWTSWQERIVPYDQIVFLEYDIISQKLSLLENIDSIEPISGIRSGYNPRIRLLPSNPENNRYRSLVTPYSE